MHYSAKLSNEKKLSFEADSIEHAIYRIIQTRTKHWPYSVGWAIIRGDKRKIQIGFKSQQMNVTLLENDEFTKFIITGKKQWVLKKI